MEARLSYSTITRLCLLFNQGRESLKDVPLSEHPLSGFTEDDITAITNLIVEDAYYTVDEISMILSINPLYTNGFFLQV